MPNEPSSPIRPRRSVVDEGTQRTAEAPGLAFLWMSAALVVSAVTSWLAWSSQDVERSAVDQALPLVVGLVILVIAIDAVIPRLGAGAAVLLLVVFAAAMGVTLSCLFNAVDLGSVTTAFVSAALMFGAAGLYGAATGEALADRRGPLLMLLGGIVIAWFLNVFVFARPVDELRISILGVVAFVGLTAWHGRGVPRSDDPRAAGRTSREPGAALSLYLEVVNVFLSLVSRVNGFVGDTREDPAWHARHGLPTERRARPR